MTQPNTPVDIDAIAKQLDEDPDFAWNLLHKIGDRLISGHLRNDIADHVNEENIPQTRKMVGAYGSLYATLRDRHQDVAFTKEAD